MRHQLFVTSFLFLALSLSACAVLTPSQVREVKKFAQASQEYSGIPGALATSYGALLRDNKLLSLCRQRYGADTGAGVDTARSDKAWEAIKQAYVMEHEFDAAGQRMDGALAILTAYSDALSEMVSPRAEETLGRCATGLGKSVDSAIDAYNARFRPTAPLAKVGGYVGQAVRHAGGLYLRHRQAEILRETVQRADPVIQGLMADVQDLALQSFRPAFQNYENNFLAPAFQSVANNNQRVDLYLVSAVYDDLARARAGVTFSEQVAAAAQAYAKAHHALAEKTAQRMDLKEALEEINILGDELCSANRAKSAAGAAP